MSPVADKNDRSGTSKTVVPSFSSRVLLTSLGKGNVFQGKDPIAVLRGGCLHSREKRRRWLKGFGV